MEFLVGNFILHNIINLNLFCNVFMTFLFEAKSKTSYLEMGVMRGQANGSIRFKGEQNLEETLASVTGKSKVIILY